MRRESFSRVEVGEVGCAITRERISADFASPRENKESVGFCCTQSCGERGGVIR